MDEIRSYPIPAQPNFFEELLASARFEEMGKGRQGTVLIRADEKGRIPIVRTTTRYKAAAQYFQPVHERLALQIQSIASLPLELNNALIETYTNAYATMGSHSDQALDLADGSFIAVFSCYKDPAIANAPRRLIVESKAPGGEKIDTPLAHNSVIVFSIATNRRLKHRIVLDTTAPSLGNPWLGITFRTSKTFLQFREDAPYFADEVSLTLANEAQRAEFYQLRRCENNEIDFTYPRITYTLSESDLLPPN